MSKNKKIYAIVGALVVALVTTIICLNIKQNSEKEFYEAFEGAGNVASAEFQPINSTVNLIDLMQVVKNDALKGLKGVSNKTANSLLDFGIYEGLEKLVAVSSVENFEEEGTGASTINAESGKATEYSEVWLFKVSAENQEMILFNLLKSRADGLNMSENLLMKKQDNIVIAIISTRTQEIEKAIDKKLKEIDGENVIFSANVSSKVSENITMEDEVKLEVLADKKLEKVEVLVQDDRHRANDLQDEVVELEYESETKKYTKEIKLSEGENEILVMAYDENGNVKCVDVGTVTKTSNGITDVKTKRNADGSISVNVQAVEGGEICISTVNETPDENANWQKYEAGKTYTLEDEDKKVQNVYVFYRANTIITEPGFATVESVSWVTGTTYTYTDSYATYTYVLDSTGKYVRITLCTPTGDTVEFPTYIDNKRVISIENTSNKYNVFGTSSSYTTVKYMTLSKGLVTIGSYAFYKCSGLTGNLVIPNSVTSIGDHAFENCSGFTGNLTIGNSVTSIGERAFDVCGGFTGSLLIPNSVIDIGNRAFEYCENFTGSLIVPNSVVSIGNRAFYECNRLTGKVIISDSLISIGEGAFSFIKTEYIEVDNQNKNYKSVDGILFSKDGRTIIQAPMSMQKENYVIPDGVISIGNYAFVNCTGFTGSLTIPNSVTNIGNYAFYYCKGLTQNLIIPDSITSIGDYAFYNCSGFTGSLTLPNSVTSIENYAFYNCSGFTGSLTLPNSVTSIGSCAFENCSGFTGSLTLLNSVTSIGSNAFYGCSGFTGNLTIGNSVTSVGSSAFENCSGLDYILLSNKTIPTNSSSSYRIYNYQKLYALTSENADVYNAVNYWNKENNGNGVYPVLQANKLPEYITKGSTFTDTGVTTAGFVTDPNGLFRTLKSYKNNSTGVVSDALDTSTVGTYTATYTLQKLNLETGNYETVYLSDGITPETAVRTIIIEEQEDFEGVKNITWVTETTYTYTDSYATYTYVLNSTGEYVRITLCTPIGDTVEFPTYIDDKRVIMIENINDGYNVFGTNTSYATVKYMTLPKGLVGIGNYAFYYCSGLNGNLVIPTSVTFVGNSAFEGCINLKGSLVIPINVRIIMNYAFKNIGSEYIDVDDDNSNYKDIEGILFSKDGTTLIQAPTGMKKTNYVVPDSVTSIGIYAFYGCSGFTGNLTIPNSVTSIGSYAFYNCSGLNGELIIGNNVTSIGIYAFYGCSGFTGNLTIPNSVTSIGVSVFEKCSGFTGNLVISASVTSIGNYAFCDCSGFTGGLIIGNSVTSIGHYAFRNCSGFTGGLTIGNSVTSIGMYAFYGCSGFTGSLTIPSSVTSIGRYAFYDCSGFTGNLVIPASVTSVEDCTFWYCRGFTSLTIENTVTNIGRYAFYNCKFAGVLKMPDSVTSIGDYAFYYCRGLEYILLSNKTIPTNSSSSYRICDYQKLYALTSENADAYNAVNYWNEENNGNGVYPVLQANKLPEYVTKGSTFTDTGATTAGFVTDPNGLFRTLKSYKNNATGATSSTLDTSIVGTYTATYTLQKLNSETGNYETVYLSDGTTPETVTRTIEVISEEPKVTDIYLVSPEPGKYKNGTEITLAVKWDQDVIVTEAPELKLKFGEDGTLRDATYVSTANNVSTYTYTISENDAGALMLVSYGAGYVNDNYARDWVSSEVTFDDEIIAMALNYKDNAGNCYETLKEAFDNASSGSTITVLRNVTDSSDAIVESGKTFTLDTNGKTITRAIVITNEGILKIIGTGTIEKNNGNIIDNSGNLEIKDVTLRISCSNTKNISVIIHNLNTGDVTINSGNLIVTADDTASNNCYGILSYGGKITINGGNIDVTTKMKTSDRGYCVASLGQGGSIEVREGTLKAIGELVDGGKGAGAILCKTGNQLIVGTKGAKANTKSPIIQGNWYGVSSEDTFEFYSGILKGISGSYAIWNDTVTDPTIPTGYGIYHDTETIDGTEYKTATLAPYLMQREIQEISGENGETIYEYKYIIGAERAGKTQYTSDLVTSITLHDTISIPNGAENWDVSLANDDSIMAWLVSDGNGKYVLHIGAEGRMFASTANHLFANYINCISINNLKFLDTSQVTDMQSMFSDCTNLTSLDVSSFDTSKVTRMYLMFNSCSNLTELNLSTFDTQNVNSMGGMFENCNKLTSLNLTGFNTSKVTNMYWMFGYCNSLKELNVSSFDTSNVTNMTYMFGYCNSLTSLNLSNFNTSSVTKMYGMFYSCSSLTSLDISNFDTSKVTTMHWMFGVCRNLTDLKLSSFNTSQVTDMSYMFAYCNNLTNLNLNNFNTNQVTDMSYMFASCNSLTNLDLSNFDTSKVKNMQSIFNGCSSLKNLNVNNFNTSNVINMQSAFNGCSSLNDLKLSSFNTSSVTNMYCVFHKCSGLTSLDISNFEIKADTNIEQMFYGCSNLNSLLLGDSFDRINNTSMFSGCTSLTSIITTKVSPMTLSTDTGVEDLTKLYVPNVEAETAFENATNYAEVFGAERIRPILELVGENSITIRAGETYQDAGVTVAGMNKNADDTYTPYGYTVSEPVIKKDDTTVSSVDTNSIGTYTLTYTIHESGETIDGMSVTRTVAIKESVYFESYLMQRETQSPNAGESSYRNDYMLGAERAGLTQYTSDLVSTITLHDTINIPSDAPSWDVSYASNGTVMAWLVSDGNGKYELNIGAEGNIYAINCHRLFAEYKNCTEINNLGILDTSNVTNMSYMFYYCKSLENLDVSDFDTSSVTRMESMFNHCEKLTNLDVSNFDTSSVTDMSYMFYYCSKLTNLNIENLSTIACSSMSNMFTNCKALTSLDVSYFKTIRTTNMSGMFAGCSGLKNIDVKNFRTVNVTDMSDMFKNCSALTSIDVSGFNTSRVESFAGMFSGCSGLTSIRLENFTTSKANSVAEMFDGCTNLKTLVLGKNFTKIDGTNMFRNCTALVRIIAKSGTPMKLSTDTGINEIAKIYVENKANLSAYTSATNYSDVFGTTRVKPMLEIVGDNPASVTYGATYEDAGATVAGWTKNEKSEYEKLGYTLTTTGLPVNTNQVGKHHVIYTLKYSNSAVDTVTN